MEAIRDLPFGVGNTKSEEVTENAEITAVSCSAYSNRVIPRKPQMKTIMFNDVDDDDNDNNKDGDGDEP